MGDWEMPLGGELEAWLGAHGLGAQAAAIAEASGAESADDLRVLDAEGIADVVRAAGLKAVPAAKLRRALGPGEPAAPGERPAAPAAAVPGPKAAFATSEYVAICIDRSGSMGAPFAELGDAARHACDQRTRMDAVKQMFYAFRDRTEALDAKHELGLLQFDNEVDKLLDCTDQLDRFEAVVDDMKKRGQTAVYSAVCAAVQLLPSGPAAKRVLCLTDGQTNCGAPVQAALEAVNAVGAVVDAIVVGDVCDRDLRCLVAATGGQCFQIQNLGEGFELLEAEGVVSLAARGLRTASRVLGEPAELVTGARALKAPEPAPAVADLRSLVVPAAGGQVAKRLGKELAQVQRGDAGVWLHSGEGVHIFPSDGLDFWRVLIEGPANSPFAGGVFALSARMPAEYPFRPPQITFETPIYHCNVSDTGQICLGILDAWSPSLTVPKALEAVRLLLATPDTDNALRQWIAELTRSDGRPVLSGELTGDAFAGALDTRYSVEARSQARQHASKTIDEWRAQWGC